MRLLVTAALILDAVVHLQLAPLYDQAAPGGIGQGNLFRLEAAAALLAAAAVLLIGNRIAFGMALLVLLSALAAVLLYRYVNVPALGPIPQMYEPIWFPKKVLTTIAEAAGTLLAAAGLSAGRRHPAEADPGAEQRPRSVGE